MDIRHLPKEPTNRETRPGSGTSALGPRSASEKGLPTPWICLAVGAIVAMLLGRLCCGDEVRYFDKDGIRWCETRRTIQRPILETQMQDTSRTIYREQCLTECRDTYRTWWTPVTETREEAVWVGRWNPFVDPRLEYRPTTRTRWEQRTEVVKTPTACRRLVPEVQSVRVPVTTQRIVQDEMISRVAMGPSPTGGQNAAPQTFAAQGSAAPSRRTIGGMARLDSDPPRESVDTAWRASTADRR